MHNRRVETILELLKRRLNEAGSARWTRIAHEAGVAESLPRKIAWDKERENPRVQTIQPLIDYFKQIDSGERKLPSIEKQAT